MNLTTVLIILIAILIIIALYVVIKLKLFMNAVLNEQTNIKQNENNINQQVENSTLELNNENEQNLLKQNPEINIEEAKQFVHHTLISMFSTIEDYNLNNISYYSDLIYIKLNNIISKQKELQQTEYFQDVKINSTYLTDIKPSKGYTSLVFEINISLKHFIKQNTEIIFGNPDETITDKYIISTVYIKNISEMEYETKRTNIHGISCPNCGENLREFKDIKCMVCGNDNSKLVENRYFAVDFNRG